jgi:kynureninase
MTASNRAQIMAIASSRAEAESLDAQDPLRPLREQFDLPEGVLYLDGNSLGAPPNRVLARLRNTAETEWRQGLIKSWNDAGWIDLPRTCGAKIATLIGAAPNEVIVADNVSVNIFKLTSAIWANAPGAIAYAEGEFPTDGYILQGLSSLIGARLLRLPEAGPEAEPDAMPTDLKILVKSVVHYKTAAVADIAIWEQAAARKGISIIWDLSHAAGIIDLKMKEAGAQYAVGCGYKFLNGGPGAPAFIYAAKDAAEKLNQPVSGWMGHAAPFDFTDNYDPAPGVQRLASGTPPILSLSVLDSALDVFAGISMMAVEAKAAALGDIFLSRCTRLGIESTSPDIGERRGGHVALRHPHGYEVVQAMIAKGAIGDFRTPDIMRFGFSPLYIQYSDVWDAANFLEQIMEKEEWRDPAYAHRHTVT